MFDPTLTGINRKRPWRQGFLQHILPPSLKNEERYAIQVVLINDGQLLTGFWKVKAPAKSS